MKKLILALIILVIVMSSSILSQDLYKNTSKTLSDKIDKINHLVSSENWEEALREVENFEKEWKDIEGIWALLIDHFEIDNIEMSFTKSKKYIETQNKTLSLAELEALGFMVEHIFEKEVLNLKNVF